MTAGRGSGISECLDQRKDRVEEVSTAGIGEGEDGTAVGVNALQRDAQLK